MSISGKSRDQCIRALTAAQNIPDVAFELLMSNVPLDSVGAAGGGVGEQAEYEDEEMPGGDGGAASGGGLAGYNLDPAVL